MSSESQEIALRYKGEDYKDCKQQLQKDGFIHQGFNEWKNPATGNTFRFVLAEGGAGYVTRVEQVTPEGPQMIETEFCDRKLAIKRFDLEKSQPKPYTDNEVKMGVIHALFNFSPSQFTKVLQRASREGDVYTNMLYKRIGVEPGDRISIKQYLFVNDGTEHEAIALYTEHKRYDREQLRTLQVGSKKLYLYRAIRLPEDMIESLLCRIRLEILIGEERVQELRLPQEC